jgi:hypothetical protein
MNQKNNPDKNASALSTPGFLIIVEHARALRCKAEQV